jgi:hypothetical protein
MLTKMAPSPHLLHVKFDQQDQPSHSDTKSRFERERHSSALATGYNSLSPLKNYKTSTYDDTSGAFPSDLDIQGFRQHLNSNGILLCVDEIKSHNNNSIFGYQLSLTKFKELMEKTFFKVGGELDDSTFTRGTGLAATSLSASHNKSYSNSIAPQYLSNGLSKQQTVFVHVPSTLLIEALFNRFNVSSPDRSTILAHEFLVAMVVVSQMVYDKKI